jgi:type VI protein secretion system component Hcp
MSDPKQQKPAEEEQIADLTVPDAQAEEVGGGESVSLNYSSVKVTYTPQKP